MFLSGAQSFRLKNNVRIIFKKTDGARTVCARIVTSVSAVSETPDNAGISYLTAKLMRRSTKNRSSGKLAADLEDIGADLFGEADYDICGLGMSFLPEYFGRAADILADVVLNPAFDEKELAFEKQNVLAAFDSRRDSIKTTVLDEFTKLFYGRMSYAAPVLGVRESVAGITREDLVEWHAYSYNASNILISVAGNIDRRIVEKFLEKYFAAVPDGAEFEDPVFSMERSNPVRKEIKGKFGQACMCVGFPAPDVLDGDFVPAKVACVILGARTASRLFAELREKLGLAYEVNSVYPSRKKQSYFAVYIALDKENIDLALKKIDGILKNFCSTAAGTQELDGAKVYIRGLYAMNRQTVGSQSYYYAWREITGQGYEYDDEYLQDVEKVTARDICRVANRMFTGYSLTVIVNPGKNMENVP